VEQYRNTNKTIPIIGQELDVEYLLEGSFQKLGEDVKLIVQLIKTKKENHLWAEEYNRNWNDIFFVQSEIAQKIAKELNTIMTPQEKQHIEKLPTSNLNAYNAYLKGNYFIFGLNHNIINPDSAMKYFELAKDLDPGFAPAYAGISYVWRYRIDFGFVSITEGSIKTIESIRKAIELDSTSAEVQHSYGTVLVETLWDWEKGELAYRKAIELNPNLAEARAFLSLLLSQLGRNEEALKLGKEATKLDPYNPYIINAYALDLFFARQYNDALKIIKEILVMDSAFSATLWHKPYVLHMLGKDEEAFKAFKEFYITHYLKDYNHAFDKGYTKGGYSEALIMEADTLLAQINMPKAQHFLLFDIAVLYTLGGNNEKGLTYLELAYRDHDPLIENLLMPIFDSMRNNTRFQDLCLKMKLPIKPNM
jgi:adenylate cyclase